MHCSFMLVNTLTNVNKWHLIVKCYRIVFNCAVYETHIIISSDARKEKSSLPIVVKSKSRYSIAKILI